MEQSFSYNEDEGVEHPLFFDIYSEFANALLGFVDPVDSPPLLPIDTLFQTDMESLISSSSLPPSTPPICEDVGSFLPFPSFSDSKFSSLKSPPLPYTVSSLHHHYIQEQPPPLFEHSPFYCPIVDPTLLFDFKAPAPQPKAAAAPNGGNSLSVQSVAARERRKRISEKTQELGRLIPSGHKMNTAEMLQAALKYVNFLQAQLQVLRLRDSIPGFKSEEEELLPVLLASPAIQERLSAEGMCIVPKKIVDELAADPELESGPLISTSMDQFVDSLIKMDDSD